MDESEIKLNVTTPDATPDITPDITPGATPDITLNLAKRNTCSGGMKTNYNGKKFEEKTNNQYRLLELGFTRMNFVKKSNGYYLTKSCEDKTLFFVLQNSLKTFVKEKYGIDLFRCPDEAYIIEYNGGRKNIKILEKKEQCVEGSVETKLWSGPSLKREYELVLGPEFVVNYAFCVNSFLQSKLLSAHNKYKTLNIILYENNIPVLFGEADNYFEKVNDWYNSEQ